MAAAIASTILGSIYNFQTDQSAETEAAGILGNVSNVIAPFATKEARRNHRAADPRSSSSLSTTSATSAPRA